MTTSTITARRFRAGRTLVAAAVSAAIVGAVAISQPWSPANAAAGPDNTMASVQDGFADMVHRVRPTVVNVQVTRAIRPAAHSRMQWRWPGMEVPERFRHFRQHFRSMPGLDAPEVPRAEGIGSGFIVDASGLIVTSHHVVKGADSVTVTLQDGRTLEAQVVGADPKTDLALLSVDAGEALPAVELGDSDGTRIGDWVVAVGNPFGLGGTVTAGIVSGRGRDIGSGPYDDYLQVDAPINRGSSGGPLFDRDGRVVGVNTAIFSPSGGNVGIGFAIPANLARPVIEALRTDGKVERGWLGVQVQHIDETLSEALGLDEARGALVASVMTGGPAAGAGLRPGDVITSFAGEKLDSMKDLPRIVAKVDSGTEVEIEVWRDGGPRTLVATIGRQGRDMIANAAAVEAEGDGDGDGDDTRLGVMLAPNRGSEEDGVTIAEVVPGSPAARNGLRAGDVIVRAGSTVVHGAEDVVGAVRSAASEDKPVLLLVERGGHRRYVAIDLDRG